jgi:hypothetical protein
MHAQMEELKKMLETENIAPGKQTKEEPTTITTKIGEVGPKISQSLVVTGERRIIKLAP